MGADGVHQTPDRVACNGSRWMFVHAHRGNTLAAGTIALAAFVIEIELRPGFGSGVRLGCVAALCVLAGLGALASPMGADGPRTYQELLLTITALAFTATVAHVVTLLGVDVVPPSAAGVTVVAAAGGGAALLLARLRDATLVLGIGAALVVVAAVVGFGALWPGDDPLRGIRLALLAAMVGLAAGVALRVDRRYAKAVALADVLAVTVVLLAATFLVERVPGLTAMLGLPDGDGHAGLAWELLLVALGFGLVGLGSTLREQGPGWLGALGLVAALTVVAGGEQGLGGWPIVLLIAGVILVAVALRPVEHVVPPDPEDAAGLEPAPAVPLPPRLVGLDGRGEYERDDEA